MDPVALVAAALRPNVSAAFSFRGRQEPPGRRGDIAIQLGGALAVLAILGIEVCAVLVAAGKTFISGTEVLEAAVFTVVYLGIIVGVYAILGRSRPAPAQPAITMEERLAAARAAALLASEGQQQRLEGVLQPEALAQGAEMQAVPCGRGGRGAQSLRPPYLLNAGEEAAAKAIEVFGAAAWRLTSTIWAKPWPKIKNKEAAREAANDLADHADDERVRGAFELQLEKFLREDIALSDELREILEEGQRAGIIASNGAVVIGGDIRADRGGVAAGRDIKAGQGGIRTGWKKTDAGG
jgi:hypothetical protein